MNPMLYCWVRYVLTLALLFNTWIKILDGYQIASLEELDLWSTSQLSLWSGVFTRRSKLSFRCLQSKVISLVILRYIEHCLLILPLICSYMWDLTSWAHIWCVSDFVLKTGCYNIQKVIAPYIGLPIFTINKTVQSWNTKSLLWQKENST